MSDREPVNIMGVIAFPNPNKDERVIRFIDSEYHTLFTIRMGKASSLPALTVKRWFSLASTLTIPTAALAVPSTISASLRKRRSATATPMFPARRKSATRSAPMKSIRSQQPLMWTTISGLMKRRRGNFGVLIISVLTPVCTQREIRWRICGQSTIGIPAPSPIGCVPCP